MDNLSPNGGGNIPEEFAKKPPLIYPKTIKLILLGLGALVVLISAFIVIKQFILPNISKTEPIAVEPIKPINENPVNPISQKPKFAYIKNQNEIWIVNTDGQEKQLVSDLKDNSENIYTTLKWKSDTELGYSLCNNEKNANCSILNINLETKAVTPELSGKYSSITKFAYSPDKRYVAFISVTENSLAFNLKSGTVSNRLDTFQTVSDPSNINSRVFFTENNEYVIFSGVKLEPADPKDKNAKPKIYSVIQVYLLNGTKVDSLTNATDPFLIDNETLGYKRENKLIYKKIGIDGESEISQFTDTEVNNPVISPDKTNIAYWTGVDGFTNVVLGVLDINSNIQRNILRGILLPKWLDNDKVAGIKADNCAGINCQLYEFQVISLVIVDINNASVNLVDQGKSIYATAR